VISDVLSEAARELRRYLRRMPSVYHEVERPLQKIALAMDAARMALDTPPGSLDPQLADVWQALDNLDLGGVTAALDALKRRGQEVAACTKGGR
jgi:hypothetical protein